MSILEFIFGIIILIVFSLLFILYLIIKYVDLEVEEGINKEEGGK